MKLSVKGRCLTHADLRQLLDAAHRHLGLIPIQRHAPHLRLAAAIKAHL